MVRTGFALVAVGIGAVALVLWHAVPVVVVPRAWGVAGLGMGLAYPSFSLITLARAGDGEEGRASSSLKLNEVLCAAMATGIGGAIIAAGESRGWEGGSMALVFALTGAIAAAGVLLAARLPGLRPAAAP